MLGISDAAEHIGMHTIEVITSFDHLANDAPMPCILHWNQKHFVVSYNINTKNGKKSTASYYFTEKAD